MEASRCLLGLSLIGWLALGLAGHIDFCSRWHVNKIDAVVMAFPGMVMGPFAWIDPGRK